MQLQQECIMLTIFQGLSRSQDYRSCELQASSEYHWKLRQNAFFACAPEFRARLPVASLDTCYMSLAVQWIQDAAEVSRCKISEI